jgi:hypothetical protein
MRRDAARSVTLSGYLSSNDGRIAPVRDGFVIGRIAGCDLVIDDSKASRKHARLVVDGGVVEIEDLDSSNGTLLNGKPVTRRVLRDGDQVQIGKTILTYREGEVPGRPAAAPAAAAPQRSPAPMPAPSTAPVDDDVDLFGSSPTAVALPRVPPASPSAAPSSPPPAVIPPRVEPAVRSAPAALTPAATPPAAAPPAAPPPAAPRPSVVEFADEIVEVRKAPPAAGKPAASAAAAEPAIQRTQRVLQFSKQAGGGGVLGDDLAQMSSGTRSLIYAVVLALAIALAWVLMRAVG